MKASLKDNTYNYRAVFTIVNVTSEDFDNKHFFKATNKRANEEPPHKIADRCTNLHMLSLWRDGLGWVECEWWGRFEAVKVLGVTVTMTMGSQGWEVTQFHPTPSHPTPSQVLKVGE